MYPLVQILHAKGYQITGSDVNEGAIIDAERALGIAVHMSHQAEKRAGGRHGHLLGCHSQRQP